jgi:hypothetical protein
MGALSVVSVCFKIQYIMEILINRVAKTPNATLGTLEIPNVFRCYTLEDVERDQKIKGKTAIPKGRYQVILSYSPRFGRMMPLLLNVPNFDGVRIHSGNDSGDTEGCLLVGFVMDAKSEVILNSRAAFDILFPLLDKAAQSEKIYLTIA